MCRLASCIHKATAQPATNLLACLCTTNSFNCNFCSSALGRQLAWCQRSPRKAESLQDALLHCQSMVLVSWHCLACLLQGFLQLLDCLNHCLGSMLCIASVPNDSCPKLSQNLKHIVCVICCQATEHTARLALLPQCLSGYLFWHWLQAQTQGTTCPKHSRSWNLKQAHQRHSCNPLDS